MDWKALLNSVFSWATNVGIKIIIAILLWIISFKIINSIARKIERKGNDPAYDKTLMRVISYIIKITAKVVVIVCLVGYVGIDTSGAMALLVSAGAAIGLALNGALGNLAGGILIIVTRPFRIDDFIEAQGISGTVEEIRIIATKLRTPDNKTVYIPNGALSGGNIINYSEKNTRRVEVKFSVDYSTDCEKAISIIEGVLARNDMILKDPAHFCKVTAYEKSSIDITARVWVKSADYWTVNFYLVEEVKKAFDKNGIRIPFNQLDVHIKNS